MIYYIDTDVMVDFFKHKESAKKLITRLSKQGNLALSTLTITELRSGWTSEQASFHLPASMPSAQFYQLAKRLQSKQEYGGGNIKRKGNN